MEEALAPLPEDSESLKVLLHSLRVEHQREKQRADQEQQRANHLHLEHLREKQRANELYLETLRLQKELFQLKKLYCCPRADRLQSEAEIAQALLEFAEQLEQKPIHPQDVPFPSKAEAGPEYELRRVKKRKGRRALANFDHLPTTTHVHELTPAERACPGAGRSAKRSAKRRVIRSIPFPATLSASST